MAAAAHARLAQSYAVGTLYLPSRVAARPQPFRRRQPAPEPRHGSMAAESRHNANRPTHLKTRPQDALACHERRWRVRQSKEWA